ncbi:MAG: hypothetical protein LH478_08285, partial [Chitinophagaceae bacterium]|nr:hypothetical protein [Chitinophagaceae bacterium]
QRNPGLSHGLAMGWNRSAGNGEANIIYNKGEGSLGGVEFGSWDGKTYVNNANIRDSLVSFSALSGVLSTPGVVLADINGVLTKPGFVHSFSIADSRAEYFDDLGDMDKYAPTLRNVSRINDSAQIILNNGSIFMNDVINKPTNTKLQFTRGFAPSSAFAFGLDVAQFPDDANPYFYLWQAGGFSKKNSTGDVVAISPRSYDGSNRFSFGSTVRGDTGSSYKYVFQVDAPYTALFNGYGEDNPGAHSGIKLNINQSGDSTAFGLNINNKNGRFFPLLWSGQNNKYQFGLVQDILDSNVNSFSIFNFNTNSEQARFLNREVIFYDTVTLPTATIIGTGGSAGQVLTSAGEKKSPVWSDPKTQDLTDLVTLSTNQQIKGQKHFSSRLTSDTLHVTSTLNIGKDSGNYKLNVYSDSLITARFSGRVIGANAVNNNEFLTLGQLKSILKLPDSTVKSQKKLPHNNPNAPDAVQKGNKIAAEAGQIFYGQEIQSSDGKTQAYKIEHNLFCKPSWYSVFATSEDAGGILYATADEECILIHYKDPPKPGAKNLSWNFSVHSPMNNNMVTVNNSINSVQ